MSLSNLFKCTIESDSSWLHLMVATPNQLVSLKLRSRATQRCPRVVLRRDDREGTTSVPVCLAPDRWPRELPNHEKVELYKEHTRDKVRRRFTLLVTARVRGTTGQAANSSGYGGGHGCCRCPRLTQIGATITVVPTENNKMLNGFRG